MIKIYLKIFSARLASYPQKYNFSVQWEHVDYNNDWYSLCFVQFNNEQDATWFVLNEHQHISKIIK